MADSQESDVRWQLRARSPSTDWIRDVSPDLIEWQRLLLPGTPIAILMFKKGVERDAVQGVVELAEADDAYDIEVSSVPLPPGPWADESEA